MKDVFPFNKENVKDTTSVLKKESASNIFYSRSLGRGITLTLIYFEHKEQYYSKSEVGIRNHAKSFVIFLSGPELKDLSAAPAHTLQTPTN